MTLFDECIQSLLNYKILSDKKSNNLFSKFEESFILTNFGKVNWDKYKKSYNIFDLKDLYNHLDKLDISLEEEIFILWDEKSLPVIQASLASILNSLEDVLAVSFDTWLYNPKKGYLVEFYHDGEVVLGLNEKN